MTLPSFSRMAKMKVPLHGISRLAEQGKWDKIKKNFESTKYRGLQRSGIIYVVLVDIYGQYRKFQDAEECLAALKSEGVQPSAIMFCALANAYAQQGLYEQTVKVLRLMEAEGIEPNLIMLNLLINAFGIAGTHLEALSVFQRIKESERVASLYEDNHSIAKKDVDHNAVPLILGRDNRGRVKGMGDGVSKTSMDIIWLHVLLINDIIFFLFGYCLDG